MKNEDQWREKGTVKSDSFCQTSDLLSDKPKARPAHQKYTRPQLRIEIIRAFCLSASVSPTVWLYACLLA